MWGNNFVFLFYRQIKINFSGKMPSYRLRLQNFKRGILAHRIATMNKMSERNETKFDLKLITFL